MLIMLLSWSPGARVRRLATHPTEQSWVVSAVQGNNEVTVWDLETGAWRQALWASHTPPLSQTQVCSYAQGFESHLSDMSWLQCPVPFDLKGYLYSSSVFHYIIPKICEVAQNFFYTRHETMFY